MEGWPLDEIIGIVVVVVVAAPAVAAVEDKDE